MSDKASYPQIPSTVWWGVRRVLHRNPSTKIDDRFLSVELGVQEAATRQYLAELKRIKIINDDGKATDLGLKWRLDESYAEAVTDIIKDVYPDSLIQVAPPGTADRNKVISWFTKEGLGSGTAKNKAATYLLIASQEPIEGAARPNVMREKPVAGADPAPKRKAATKEKVPAEKGNKNLREEDSNSTNRRMSPALNLNLQIHISADASQDQIEAIFSAMKRYLHDDADH